MPRLVSLLNHFHIFCIPLHDTPGTQLRLSAVDHGLSSNPVSFCNTCYSSPFGWIYSSKSYHQMKYFLQNQTIWLGNNTQNTNHVYNIAYNKKDYGTKISYTITSFTKPSFIISNSKYIISTNIVPLCQLQQCP